MRMLYREMLSVVLLFLLIFAAKTIAQTSEDEIRYLSELSFEELLRVEIDTAGKFGESIGYIPASVVIITREDIEDYGYMDVEEILQNIPGLYLINDYYGSNLGVRGFWSDAQNRNVIVLINGVNVRDDNFDNYRPMFVNVPVEAIDRVEVIRGPMGITYGSGAFFGVINIVTNDPAHSGRTNLVSLSAGSEGRMKVAVSGSDKKEDLEYSFNGMYSYTDGFSVPYSTLISGDPSPYGISPDDSINNMHKSRDTYFDFSASNGDLSAKAIVRDQELDFTFSLPSAPRSDPSQLRQWDYFVKLAWQKQVMKAVALESNVTFTRHVDEGRFFWFNEYFYADQRLISQAVEGEINALINAGDSLDITVGTYLRRITDIRNVLDAPDALQIHNILATTRDDVQRKAAFIQAEYKITPRLNLVAGIRLEQLEKYIIDVAQNQGFANRSDFIGTYDKDGYYKIPRLALVYSPDDRHFIKLMYGKALNMPSVFQNFTALLSENELSLEPEEIESWEINYIGTFGDNFLISGSLFRNAFDNLIVRAAHFDEQGEHDKTTNSGSMTTNGLEASIKYNGKPFQLELSASIQNTDDDTSGREDVAFSFSPDYLIYLKARYDLTSTCTLGVTCNYIDSMHAYYNLAWDDEGRQVGSYIGDDSDGYINLGLNLRLRSFLHEGTYLNLRISNALDAEIRHPTTYNNTWANMGYLQPGRVALFTVGHSF